MQNWNDVLDSLNPAQRKAVESPEGHLLIHAGAGTGKTRTLAARTLFLQFEMGIPSGAILALSFSRAARQQLLDRLSSLGWEAGGGSPVQVLTFHGLAWRVVRMATDYGETWLRPNFEIVSSGRGGISPLFDQYSDEFVKAALGTAFRLNGIRWRGYAGRDILERFEQFDHADFRLVEDWRSFPELSVPIWAKGIDMLRQGHPEFVQALVSPEELKTERLITILGNHSVRIQVSTRELRVVWQRYNQILKRRNMIDYPGLVAEAVRILRKPDSLTAHRLREGLRFVMVDEYQDTSRAQEAMLFQLAGSDVNLNVVGDARQAIYTFNGSDVSNILEFPLRAALTGKRVLDPVHLEWNYRSAESILCVANRIAKKLEVPKEHRGSIKGELQQAPVQTSGETVLWRQSGLDVRRVYAPRIDLAADFVATEIERLIKEERVHPGHISVLVRKDSEYSPQASFVIKELERRGIPLHERDKTPESKRVLATKAMTLCQQHFNSTLEELIDGIICGGFAEELEDEAERNALAELLRESLQSGAVQAWEALETLQDVLEEDGFEKTADTGGVSVRTVHSAKGLEFRIVFLMYLGSRTFPHGIRHDPAEERRLFYVGITRAIERLYLLGTPGPHHADFFGESTGERVHHVDWTVPGGREVFSGSELSAEYKKKVSQVKQRQSEEEERKRKLLAQLLGSLD
ncbi:UvrD-helicase domain-containing protein [Heliobacterium undosum]|uniref:DNA 3'-5' helicase n=1 Tax=Heliomicrobium undosum TaxID=121734 RepID=A0A845LEL9_9FIRM|nr:ATP-dependent helicase [Heliomicrobium undosum]MZP31371.1 UvrD-helicase domain-containing protein [Heliomicrobium undosum]